MCWSCQFAYLENDIEIKGEKQGVVICPGPNLAYFDKEVSLSEMTKHIYGNTNILSDLYRPNIFINELKMYVDHLKKGMQESLKDSNAINQKKWKTFKQNLLNGIAYYEDLLENTSFFQPERETIKKELQEFKLTLLG